MCFSRFRSYLGNRRGATSVELVLTLPFFLATVFMIAETSIYFFATSNAEKAAHAYSRQIIQMETAVNAATHEERIWAALESRMNRQFFESMRFAIDTAGPNTNFANTLTKNLVGANIFENRDRPVFLRVVFQPRGISSVLTRPLWRAIGAAGGGGFTAPIDILIVIPFPARGTA